MEIIVLILVGLSIVLLTQNTSILAGPISQFIPFIFGILGVLIIALIVSYLKKDTEEYEVEKFKKEHKRVEPINDGIHVDTEPKEIVDNNEINSATNELNEGEDKTKENQFVDDITIDNQDENDVVFNNHVKEDTPEVEDFKDISDEESGFAGFDTDSFDHPTINNEDETDILNKMEDEINNITEPEVGEEPVANEIEEVNFGEDLDSKIDEDEPSNTTDFSAPKEEYSNNEDKVNDDTSSVDNESITNENEFLSNEEEPKNEEPESEQKQDEPELKDFDSAYSNNFTSNTTSFEKSSDTEDNKDENKEDLSALIGYDSISSITENENTSNTEENSDSTSTEETNKVEEKSNEPFKFDFEDEYYAEHQDEKEDLP